MMQQRQREGGGALVKETLFHVGRKGTEPGLGSRQ